jgi:hypothetical protein
MPLTSAVGRAPIRSSVVKPASPAAAREAAGPASHAASSKGTRAISSRSRSPSGRTAS